MKTLFNPINLLILLIIIIVFLTNCTSIENELDLLKPGSIEISSSSEETSSSSEETSSSSEENSSSSSEETSSSSGDGSSSSFELSSSSSEALKECTVEFNPNNRFCYDGDVYVKCDGMEYNPTTHICEGDIYFPAKCNGVQYNPLKQRCEGNVIETKCGTGNTYYNSLTHFCQDPDVVVVKELCGDKPYTAAQFCCNSEIGTTSTEFCQEDTTLKLLCGNETFDATEFCYNDKIGTYCGTRKVDYDTDLYECNAEINPNGIYWKGTISYNGKYYKAVLIGSQTWITENMNYGVSGSKCGTDSKEGDFYLLSDSNTEFCDEYGRLYDWATAMAFSANCNTNTCSSLINSVAHQGVCPSGWHIPKDSEWDVLMRYIQEDNDEDDYDYNVYNISKAGKYIKDDTGSEDKYGFAARDKAGVYIGGYGYWKGYGTAWWSSTEDSNIEASSRMMIPGEGNWLNHNVRKASASKEENLISVRCVKN